MDTKDYYAILHIDPAATDEEVRAAYKRLAMLHHPDLSSDPLATLYMQLLNEAYDVLKSPEERRRYDALLGKDATPDPPSPPPPPTETTTVDLDETQPVRVRRRDPQRERTRKQAMLNPLKALMQLILMMTVWFTFSLASGKVDLFGVVVFVVLGVYIIAMLVARGKGIGERG